MALDFSAFWAAARLVANGHPAAAYDNVAIEATERAATIMPPGYLAFYYPPTFLLLVSPLGRLSYSAALAAFLVLETALVVALLRRVLPQGWAWLALLAFPGLLMNALSGQNAALSASCFAAAAVWLESRPWLGGARRWAGSRASRSWRCACRWRFWRREDGGRCWRAAPPHLCWPGCSWAVTRPRRLAGLPGQRAECAPPTSRRSPSSGPKMQSLFGAITAGRRRQRRRLRRAGRVMSLAAMALLAWIAARRAGA